MKEWEEYFQKLSELKGFAGRVLKVWEELRNRMHNYELRELSSSDALMKIALGGLRGEAFSENALGLFYRELYGLSFDFKEVVMRAKVIEREEDKIPEEALEIKVDVNKSYFIELVEGIVNSLAGAILEAEVEEEVRLEDPYVGVEAARLFLEKALEISPASCRESFVILALNGISRRYMKIASKNFPEMSDENFEGLKKLFELSPILEPELPTRNLCEEYTIWGFPKGTAGCSIFEAIGTLWEITELPSIQKYFGIRSELERYVEKAYPAYEKALPKGKLADETLRKIKMVGERLAPGVRGIEGRISNIVGRLGGSYIYSGYLRLLKTKLEVSTYHRSYYKYRQGKEDEIDFPAFFDCLSPALFFKLGGFGEWTVGPDSKTIWSELNRRGGEDIRWWVLIP